MKPLGQGRIMTRDKKQIQRTINRSQELPIELASVERPLLLLHGRRI